MIVEVWVEGEGLRIPTRRIGWISIVSWIQGDRRHMTDPIRVGPWVVRDPETGVWDEHGHVHAGGASPMRYGP